MADCLISVGQCVGESTTVETLVGQIARGDHGRPVIAAGYSGSEVIAYLGFCRGWVNYLSHDGHEERR